MTTYTIPTDLVNVQGRITKAHEYYVVCMGQFEGPATVVTPNGLTIPTHVTEKRVGPFRSIGHCVDWINTHHDGAGAYRITVEHEP